MTRQEAENLQDGMEKMAGMLRIFYNALMAAGFEDHRAMYLTMEYMKATVSEIGEKAAAIANQVMRE